MYKYRHFLNFKDIPDLGTIEISEPIGFDASTHKVEQSEFFGRDVVKADEKIDLAFTRDTFGILSNPIPNIDGIRQTHLSNAFDWILNVIESFGWETEIEWTVKDQMGVDHVVGIIDVFTAQVEFDCIKFNVIQHTKREIIKRRKDVVINAFSDKDLDGNPITPCATTEILMVAKPTFKTSNWNQVTNKFIDFSAAIGDRMFNFSKNLKTYGISVSNPPWDEIISSGDPVVSFRIIHASTMLQNVVVKYDSDMFFSGSTFDGDCQLILYAVVSDDTGTVIDFDPAINRMFYHYIPEWSSDIRVDIPHHLETTIPVIPAGGYLSVYWRYAPEIGSGLSVTSIKADIEIDAESVAFDSILRGVRLIDLIRHNVASVSGLPVISPLYDKIGSVAGPHYDNFAFNGYMLANTPLYPIDKDAAGNPKENGKPFNNQFEDLMKVPLETCHGYQINRTSVEILPYVEFYKDVDLGGFIADVNSENSYIYDKDYFLKTFTFGYDKSSSERETNGENTIDDIHTKTQRLFPSIKTDGNKNIELKHVRSHFLMEIQRRKAVDAKDSTSLQYDDTLFVVDCVPRAPSLTSKIYAILLHRREFGSRFLEILNTDLEGHNIGINWVLLGLRVGASFWITPPSENNGTYIVRAVTETVLTLEMIGPYASAAYTGNALTRAEYTIPGVLYTIRTTEGFADVGGVKQIFGVKGKHKYGNLMYSLGRNTRHWLPYLSTAMNFLKNKEITTTEFKINEHLETQTQAELAAGIPILKDNAPIKEVDIRHMRVIHPIIHKVSVIVDCDTAMMLLDDIETKKGFIRVQISNGKIIRGYPKKINYIWSTNQLEMELQEKNGRETVRLTKELLEDGTTQINIDEVGYPIHHDLFSYEVNYDFVTFRDSSRILIMNPTHWRDIEINGVSFTDKISFMDALNIFLA